MEFLLMNKDMVVLKFCIERGQLSTSYTVTSPIIKSKLPLDLRDIGEWLDSRYILNYRNSIKVFFRLLGVNTIEEFISITNCVSLKDTYWVKPVNSEKTWKTVSPYKNPLNKVIADYSFDRKVMGKNITGSPDFSTDGNFPKCWRREKGTLFLYKAGSSGAMNAGNEPYSEIYAYHIARILGIAGLRYDIRYYHGKLISKCECMTSENVGLISFRDLYNIHSCNFEELLNSSKGSAIDYYVDMLLLDYVTCNVDRHYGNIGFHFNTETNRILGFTRIFDNNLSCIPYYVDDENLEYYVGDIRAKDGRSFDELYQLIDSRYTRGKLKLLKNKDISIGCPRDKYVNDMVQFQIRKILG